MHTDALREAWKNIQLKDGEDLPTGPSYCTPEENSSQFQDPAPFRPGGIHEKVDAWEKLDPPMDKEVLHWIREGYTVFQSPETTGIRCCNGKLARKNPEALKELIFKRLKEGSWESTTAEWIINILPANLAAKPTAQPPWRLIINGIPI